MLTLAKNNGKCLKVTPLWPCFYLFFTLLQVLPKSFNHQIVIVHEKRIAFGCSEVLKLLNGVDECVNVLKSSFPELFQNG